MNPLVVDRQRFVIERDGHNTSDEYVRISFNDCSYRTDVVAILSDKAKERYRGLYSYNENRFIIDGVDIV